MAACVKCLLPLLLLVGMLGLLTVSASAEDVKVTFLFEQRLDSNGFPLIRGNISSLTNSKAMTPTSDDIWVLTVKVTKGVPYEYYLRVLPQGFRFECTCLPTHRTVLTVPEDYPYSIYPEIVTGYDCNTALCPRSIRQVV
ncbi:hypothetical protein SUGI_0706440 [Cryptomeria japonica]|uniref:uncharacterized protein LOC131028314 n=1 Tax=Cryptomeria japonica TaxID=3369 RepID=UPI002414C9DB|nr:uncharacterized protein LOC131028314 [Cryptomeria japonica]GLJ35100.1 hypothetical protein SUGI_0706440 [Cryptomeria japonica]